MILSHARLDPKFMTTETSPDAPRKRRRVPSTFAVLVWCACFEIFVLYSPALHFLAEKTWPSATIELSLKLILAAFLLPIYLRRDGLAAADLGLGVPQETPDFVRAIAAGILIWTAHSSLLLAAQAWAGGAPINLFVNSIHSNPGLPRPLEMSGMFLNLVVLTPIFEEVFYRGCLIAPMRITWGASPRKDLLYAVLSGALFSIGHRLGHPLYYAIYGLTGFAFAVLYQKTRSLRASMIAHGAVNFLCILVVA